MRPVRSLPLQKIASLLRALHVGDTPLGPALPPHFRDCLCCSIEISGTSHRWASLHDKGKPRVSLSAIVECSAS